MQYQNERFLRLNEVISITSLCKSSIYNLIKSGNFPNNITVMGKRKAWVESGGCHKERKLE
nr:AlpA family phage regulatory protein [Echinimonas agarilytica]